VANLVDDSGAVNSNLVSGNGTNSARFTMPGNVALNVESVVATVNNAAGGDTRATLVVRDQSGVVIATKRQGEVIPAGDTGTATFALRLSDNELTGPSSGYIRFDVNNVGGFLKITTTGGAGTEFHGSTLAGFAFYVPVGAGAFYVEADTPYFDVLNGIFRIVNAALFNVQATAIDLVGADGISLTSHGAFAQINLVGPSFVQLRVGDVLEVQDHLGNPIFRVDEDGDLHGKTGKALVFDL
jgi:hypothetical protein